jgi:hypothetical protein
MIGRPAPRAVNRISNEIETAIDCHSRYEHFRIEACKILFEAIEEMQAVLNDTSSAITPSGLTRALT